MLPIPDLPAVDFGDFRWTNEVADWGVPDWRHRKGYPDSKKISPWQWAWEFRRRNPDYRLSWMEGSRAAPFDPTKPINPEFELGLARVVVGPEPVRIAENEAAIVIKLDNSFDEQLAVACRVLTAQFPALRRRSPAVAKFRSRPNEYIRYLRALDGRMDGADTKEIARHLKCTPKEVRRYQAVGDQLSWAGYFFLALKPQGRAPRKKPK